MALGGVAGCGLVAWFTGDRLFNSNEGPVAIVVQSTVVIAVVAVVLWRMRQGGWRAFAAGLAGTWAALLVIFGVLSTDTGDTRDPPGFREANASGYYLGEETDGMPENQRYPAGDLWASGVTVGYGPACPDDGDAFCDSDVYVTTLSVSREYLEGTLCARLAPVMGVPAARSEFGLLVFTGTWMVLVEDIRAGSGLPRLRALASRLRLMESSAPPATLPPPSPKLRALVDDACSSRHERRVEPPTSAP
jgi:hypothetical protein